MQSSEDNVVIHSQESSCPVPSLTASARRCILKAAGISADAIGAATVLASCGIQGAAPTSPGDVLKIDFVSPQTGPLAGFAGSDAFVVKQVNALLVKGFAAVGQSARSRLSSRTPSRARRPPGLKSPPTAAPKPPTSFSTCIFPQG